MASESIQADLLSAQAQGQTSMKQFVDDRLKCPENGTNPNVLLREPVKKNNPLTFASLYKVEKSTKSVTENQKVLKADRTILHRLLIEYKAGIHVNMDAILKHELLPVPISMSETNGRLRGGNNAILFDELTNNSNLDYQVHLVSSSTLISMH